tara:strand:- start:63 stop:596 length:534 start_codon:yes stop_codon:yes gene_type:complete
MGKKWTEVDVYTGLVKNEDAPVNRTGAAVAGTGDDDSVVVVKKKKDKQVITMDARTKEYREHRKRLEQARQRRLARLEKKESNLVKKVKEQIGEFSREEHIQEDNVADLKSIVKNKSAKNIKFKDGSLKVDLFTASAMTKIMDKVNPQNKKKIMDMINNGTKSQFLKLQQVAMKAVK